MKFFTNRSITKKVTIVVLTVLMLTFAIPKPVSATNGWDFVGDILTSPITIFLTKIADGAQWVLEWIMMGRPNYFMNTDIGDVPESTTPSDKAVSVPKGTFVLANLLVQVPDIQYTPENIFANRIPALDINFINPSVKTGNDNYDNKHNIAIKLQDVIASWYKALRMMALVGLLSVLVYIGIRILLTSIAADRVKYKKMIMDWLVALCLLFVLHYIMSFALTMAEVVTSMITPSQAGAGTVAVYVEDIGRTIDMSLMNYVRFMMQSPDFGFKIGYLALYIMLVIYTWRFTWTYLKRVINMAFLTIIAPLIAVTYPIDKVGDGKAQAFDMWIKEFTYNALLQPLHLLLYTVLLGTAAELAMVNPLYAVVALGFILAGEKLFKSMFGFNKAGAGTVGSLAGAAAVSTLATKALMGGARKVMGGKGGPDKVRTNNKYQREGRDNGANKGYNTFDNSGNSGLNELEFSRTPPPSGDSGEGEMSPPSGDIGERETSPLSEGDGEKPLLDEEEFNQYSEENLRRTGYPNEDEERPLSGKEDNDESFVQEESKEAKGSDSVKEVIEGLGREEEVQPETWQDMWRRDRREAKLERDLEREERKNERAKKREEKKTDEYKRKRAIERYKTFKGVKSAAGTMAYKAARGTLKAIPRVAVAGALAATAGVIGATTGDGEKALAAAGGAALVGGSIGGKAFEATVGKHMPDNRTVVDSYGAGKYGSAIAARNKKADDEYIRSQQHRDEYENYFKPVGKLHMSKQEYDKAVREYRQVGITDTKDIRNALKLEQQYKTDGKNHGSAEDIRGKVQNIVQTYGIVNKRAVYGEDKNATEAALKNIETQLTNVKGAKQKRAVANEILQGYRDWYNI